MDAPVSRLQRVSREGWEKDKTSTMKIASGGELIINESTDENEFVSESRKNGLGQEVLQILPGGLEVSYDYDEYGRLTTVTQPEGTQFTYAYNYDETAEEITLTKNIPGGGESIIKSNLKGEKISEETPKGDVFTYEYDDYGRVLKTKLNGNTVSETGYHGYDSLTPKGHRGQVYFQEDYLIGAAFRSKGGSNGPNFNKTEYEYDNFGRLDYSKYTGG